MVFFCTGMYGNEVGPGGILQSFFSTICVRLENSRWGARFPRLMKDLYDGRLQVKDVPEARKELEIVQREFSALPQSSVVWDFEHLEQRPPWGDQVIKHATSMADYYITSNGLDLIGLLFDVFDDAEKLGEDVVIKSIPKSAMLQVKPEERIRRRDWISPERTVENAIGDCSSQVSFLNGKQTAYGTPNSSRPDFFKAGACFDVDAYDPSAAIDKERLTSSIAGQVSRRQRDLPADTVQAVILYLTGNRATKSDVNEINALLKKKSKIGIGLMVMGGK